MTRVRVKIRSAGMDDLLHDPGVAAELERRAQRVLADARVNAPVVTGGFRASLGIRRDTTDRVVVRVGSDHPAALAIEARTGVLARALGAAGGS